MVVAQHGTSIAAGSAAQQGQASTPGRGMFRLACLRRSRQAGLRSSGLTTNSIRYRSSGGRHRRLAALLQVTVRAEFRWTRNMGETDDVHEVLREMARLQATEFDGRLGHLSAPMMVSWEDGELYPLDPLDFPPAPRCVLLGWPGSGKTVLLQTAAAQSQAYLDGTRKDCPILLDAWAVVAVGGLSGAAEARLRDYGLAIDRMALEGLLDIRELTFFIDRADELPWQESTKLLRDHTGGHWSGVVATRPGNPGLSRP